jgi:hypothetical protein
LEEAFSQLFGLGKEWEKRLGFLQGDLDNGVQVSAMGLGEAPKCALFPLDSFIQLPSQGINI